MLQTGLLNAVSFKEASMWKETISEAFVLCLLRCEDPGFSVQHAKALQGMFYELVFVCVCLCVCVCVIVCVWFVCVFCCLFFVFVCVLCCLCVFLCVCVTVFSGLVGTVGQLNTY